MMQGCFGVNVRSINGLEGHRYLDRMRVFSNLATLPCTSMSHHCEASKPKKMSERPNPNWFETMIYSGEMILDVIRNAASRAPTPYLRQSASKTINIIDTIQV